MFASPHEFIEDILRKFHFFVWSPRLEAFSVCFKMRLDGWRERDIYMEEICSRMDSFERKVER